MAKRRRGWSVFQAERRRSTLGPWGYTYDEAHTFLDAIACAIAFLCKRRNPPFCAKEEIIRRLERAEIAIRQLEHIVASER